jgi:hypothetical protein
MSQPRRSRRRSLRETREGSVGRDSAIACSRAGPLSQSAGAGRALRAEPLRRLPECVFGVLRGESEPLARRVTRAGELE